MSWVGKSRSLRSLIEVLREDLGVHMGGWSLPGFHAVAIYRLGTWSAAQPRLLTRVVGSALYSVLFVLVRNLYGIEIPRGARVGRRLRVGHQSGIIINEGALIGDDCILRQNVTIGSMNRGRRRPPPHVPQLGDRIDIAPGAVLLGGIHVGDDVSIGPNAVVLTDVAAGSSVFGPPAKAMAGLKKPAPAVVPVAEEH